MTTATVTQEKIEEVEHEVVVCDGCGKAFRDDDRKVTYYRDGDDKQRHFHETCEETTFVDDPNADDPPKVPISTRIVRLLTSDDLQTVRVRFKLLFGIAALLFFGPITWPILYKDDGDPWWIDVMAGTITSGLVYLVLSYFVLQLGLL